ncbi:hypothetical protein [Streptosporangium sp. NPDC020145]|uniref:hypothetical protein n=1 Tax=Streptosporangium sp. NPDC020145 TaxID=3154694 RepID=UPI0034336CB8
MRKPETGTSAGRRPIKNTKTQKGVGFWDFSPHETNGHLGSSSEEQGPFGRARNRQKKRLFTHLTISPGNSSGMKYGGGRKRYLRFFI